MGNEWRVKSVQFAFDERRFPEDIGVPLGSKHGVVLMKFTDETAISKACQRKDFEQTLVDCFNKKLESPPPNNKETI